VQYSPEQLLGPPKSGSTATKESIVLSSPQVSQPIVTSNVSFLVALQSRRSTSSIVRGKVISVDTAHVHWQNCYGIIYQNSQYVISSQTAKENITAANSTNQKARIVRVEVRDIGANLCKQLV
jgi:hypothetical protein